MPANKENEHEPLAVVRELTELQYIIDSMATTVWRLNVLISHSLSGET